MAGEGVTAMIVAADAGDNPLADRREDRKAAAERERKAIPNNSNTRQLCLEPREVAERLGRGVGANNALKGLADAVVRKLESIARDIGRRDAGNVLGLCAGDPFLGRG